MKLAVKKPVIASDLARFASEHKIATVEIPIEHGATVEHYRYASRHERHQPDYKVVDAVDDEAICVIYDGEKADWGATAESMHLEFDPEAN